MADDLQKELDDAIEQIVESSSHRKLIVAGPGTGKTTLFRRVLEGGDKHQRLVMTFINNLKAELDAKLGTLADVFTFHGYCHYQLRRHEKLRRGLTERFHYYPDVASFIKRDSEIFHRQKPAPQFIGQMRELQDNESTRFYLDRANYYDAVQYDDSIYRVYRALRKDPSLIGKYELVLVDEFQDFNQLEASFIEVMATQSPVLIVGDDDQALYSQLRGASYDYIRGLHSGGDYACFTLPFCMRCPKAIVDTINSIVARARQKGHLTGRIDKPFKYFPAKKGEDSEKYPTVKLVKTSVQSLQVNYCGRYIAEAVDQITPEEIAESWAEDFPTALVIGSVQYLRQIGEYLKAKGYQVEEKEPEAPKNDRDEVLKMLRADLRSNLGWRILWKPISRVADSRRSARVWTGPPWPTLFQKLSRIKSLRR
jgi:superfamily I DNA/RNA helicase